MAQVSPAAASSTASDRWLFGPLPDLILGCGVGYAVMLVAMLALGPEIKQWLPAGILTLVLLFTTTPHYGATLMRVYAERESRQRYAVFAVWISAGLAIVFAAACYWHQIGSWLVTVYFNWSPWHYAGQNYGIALMFLHRRGVPVSPTAKRWLYASFVLAFLLAFVRINGVTGEAPYAGLDAPSADDQVGPVYSFLSIGIPPGIRTGLTVIGLSAYLIATGAAFNLLRRGGSLRDLVPTAMLVVSQSLWFVVPTLCRTFQWFEDSVPFSMTHLQYAFLFVAIGHAVQYLWITAYYARREHSNRGTPRFLAQCLLASCIIWYVPAFIFAPASIGIVGYGEGLALLIAAVVNIHHFVLDGAVWKLRDGKVASVLLRSSAVEPRGEVAPTARKWIRPTVWAVGAFCFAVGLVGDWEREFGVRRAAASGDIDRLETGIQRLVWIGQDSASMHRRLGAAAAREGRPEQALEELEKSLALKQHPKAWFGIGHIYAERGQWDEAVRKYEAAYALDPFPKKLIGRYAWALEKTDDFERARQVLRTGLGIHRDAPMLHRQLQQLERRIRAAKGGAATDAPP